MTDVFLICYNVVLPSSYSNVKEKVCFVREGNGRTTRCDSFQWAPEVAHYSPKTPFLLVGTQIDLRDDPETLGKLERANHKVMTVKQGEKLAQEIKAVKYVECSAKTQVKRRILTFVRSIRFLFLSKD